MSLPITEFDPATASNMHSIAILGKRQCGKTTLIHDLLQYMKCEHITIVNPLEPSTKEYASNVTQDMTVHSEYSADIVKDFAGKGKRDHWRCIVFDSCIYDNNVMKHPSMRYIYQNGRCIQAKKIMVLGYPLAIPVFVRNDMDYVFLFKETRLATRRRLYETYAGMFHSFEEFCRTFDCITCDPFTCMVLSNTTTSVTNQIMYYKVPVPWKHILARKTKEADIIREDFMRKTWHPSRLTSSLPYDAVIDIFGSTSTA